jgi:hypothetical protein
VLLRQSKVHFTSLCCGTEKVHPCKETSFCCLIKFKLARMCQRQGWGWDRVTWKWCRGVDRNRKVLEHVSVTVSVLCLCKPIWSVGVMRYIYCTLCGQNALFDIQAGGSYSDCCALKNWFYFQLLGQAHTEEILKHNATEIS